MSRQHITNFIINRTNRAFIIKTNKSTLSGRTSYLNRLFSHKVTNETGDEFVTKKSWSDEWKTLGLGAKLPKPGAQMTNLLFVETGFGVDQHGDRGKEGATKAAVRAVRNAIEFNSIPGIMEAVPGGRKEMLIQVKLGIPAQDNTIDPIDVDLSEIAKVFPYGRLMPIHVVVGGLLFPTGRIVRELGDEDDVAICVVASISIGYDNGKRTDASHTTYDKSDGS